MRRRAGVIVAAAALCVPAGARLEAQTARPWLHVRVDEPETRVRVNLPLTVVGAALKAAPEIVASEGRIRLGRTGKQVSVSDLRRMWAELKVAGDAELVAVEDKDEQVKLLRQGDVVRVHVEKSGKEHVRVELPVAVVDALLSGEGDAVNLQAALDELQRRRGDIVRVTDDKTTVRVWIDEEN